MRMVCVVIVLLAAPGMALGTAIQLRVAGETSVVAAPGDTLAVDVHIEGASVDIAAFDGLLTASRSHVLCITGRTFNRELVPFPPFDLFRYCLNPSSPAIGTLLLGHSPDLGAIPIQTISVRIADDWDGQEVTLLVTGPIVSDALGNAVPLDSPVPLVITPEPAGLLLLGLGAPLLRRRRG